MNPGSVVTPIWDKAEHPDASSYASTEYAPFLGRFLEAALKSGRAGLPADAVARVVWKALTDDIPFRWAFYPILRRRLLNWTIPLALPARLLDRLIAKRLGFESHD